MQIDLSIPSGAIFTDDRKYRYALWRIWNPTKQIRLQIGLNPSSANEVRNDPTITRGIKRASNDGFGGFIQANMYAYVSTNPNVLLGDGDFIGELNDDYIRYLTGIAGQTICGWGSFKPVFKRATQVLSMIKESYCLGVNSDGQPKHPLYIGYEVPVIKYEVKK